MSPRVASVAMYPDFADDPIGDELVMVDDVQVGGTYHCADGTWASWGAGALSMHHDSRAAAMQVQVQAYLVDPERFRQAQAREAAQAAPECVEPAAPEEFGEVVLVIPAHHCLYAPDAEARAVVAWLHAHGILNACGDRPIRVEKRTTRQVILFEVPHPFTTATTTHAVTLRSPAPEIHAPARLDIESTLTEHRPATFPLLNGAEGCVACTGAQDAPDDAVSWPCEPLMDAIRAVTA